jgi:hypothetical protein
VGQLSYLFEMGDQEVWGPSNRVAQLYLGMIQTVATVLDRPTGLSENAGGGGWYDVDRTDYSELITAMVREFASSGHWEFRLMIGSLLGVSIGILDRAGIQIETRTERERKAVAELREAAF